MAHLHRLGDLRQRLTERAGPQQQRPVAQLGRPVAQRGQDQMSLLPVHRPSAEQLSDLHQQHRLVGVVEEVWPELVGQQPSAAIHAAILPTFRPSQPTPVR